jgi:hypothetical protein
LAGFVCPLKVRRQSWSLCWRWVGQVPMRMKAAGCVMHWGVRWGFYKFYCFEKFSVAQMGWPNIPRLAKGIIARVIYRRCRVLSGVLSLRCLSRVLLYFVSSVFTTTRISTCSRSYQSLSLGVRIWWIPPQDRNIGISLEIVLLVISSKFSRFWIEPDVA